MMNVSIVKIMDLGPKAGVLVFISIYLLPITR